MPFLDSDPISALPPPVHILKLVGFILSEGSHLQNPFELFLKVVSHIHLHLTNLVSEGTFASTLDAQNPLTTVMT